MRKDLVICSGLWTDLIEVTFDQILLFRSWGFGLELKHVFLIKGPLCVCGWDIIN